MNQPLKRLLCTSAAVWTMSAAAALAAEPANQIEEVVVTAQKRAQSLQDIGVAVSAIGKTGLEALGRQDVTALATQVPSLQVNQYSPTITVFNIRGVSQNDFADSQEAPIAYYSDEVYISSLGAISGTTYDLERIEVLRGPQGTLFGRNATGGLTQILSAAPTRSPEGFLTVSAQSHGQYTTEGAISGPLTDTLRGRVSFTTSTGGAYIHNLAGRDLGRADFYAGRIQLAGDVGSDGEFKIKLEGLRNNHDRQAGLYTHAPAFPNSQGLGEFIGPTENPWNTCPGCDALGYRSPSANPFTGAFNGPNYFDRSYWSATGRYEQNFDSIKLTSISNYQSLAKKNGEDDDMSPVSNFQYSTSQHLYQLSQEFRLSQDLAHTHWVAGLYALKIHTFNSYNTDTTGAFGLDEIYRTILDTETLAAFGQGEVAVGHGFSVIGGLRVSKDWKKYDYLHQENGLTDFVFNPTTFPQYAKLAMGAYSAKGEIDYRPGL
ncbi:MAG TPA: TonB-dependent receptor plug domain-containing protein, partial [Caulobacteraceae bacterium]|nr:TonB-dependent receptor plug domain-containing protein [Caulobacteraceae bacterium]